MHKEEVQYHMAAHFAWQPCVQVIWLQNVKGTYCIVLLRQLKALFF